MKNAPKLKVLSVFVLILLVTIIWVQLSANDGSKSDNKQTIASGIADNGGKQVDQKAKDVAVLQKALKQYKDDPGKVKLLKEAKELLNVDFSSKTPRTMVVQDENGKAIELTYQEYKDAGGISVTSDEDGRETHTRLPLLKEVLEKRNNK